MKSSLATTAASGQRCWPAAAQQADIIRNSPQPFQSRWPGLVGEALNEQDQSKAKCVRQMADCRSPITVQSGGATAGWPTPATNWPARIMNGLSLLLLPSPRVDHWSARRCTRMDPRTSAISWHPRWKERGSYLYMIYIYLGVRLTLRLPGQIQLIC